MAWYWWVLELSANLVEAGLLVFFIQQFSEARYKDNTYPYCISTIIVFGIITVANRLQLLATEIFPFFIAVGVAVGFLAYKGSVVSRILLPIITTAFLIVTEVIAMGILKLVFQTHYAEYVEISSVRMVGILMSKVFLAALVYIAGRFSKKENVKIPLVFGLCLLLVPAISIVCMITIVRYTVYGGEEQINPLWFAFSALGLLLLNLLIVYLFRAIMNYSRNQNRLQLMVQQEEMLNRHLNETNALQEETQKIWHDMKNHFTVIQWMVKQRSYDKLENYMQTLNDAVVSSMPKYQTGNHILDALLNAKAAEAKNGGIEFIVNAAVPPRLSIDDLDLNIVISNALDNAIEACRKLPEDKEKSIFIDAMIKNDHLFLTVKNPYAGELRINGNRLETTKADAGRHGIGMGNMMRAVEKYDGHILTDYKDNLFTLSATMYCKFNG
jgi:two-component system sensor histidine kinase AgrC